MKTNVNRDYYVIYIDIETNLHVAVSKEHVPIIEKTMKSYKNTHDIPVDKLIKGIYLKDSGPNEFNMVNKIEADVKIKNLRFDNQ